MAFTRGLNITYFCDAEADRSTSWEQYAVAYCAAEGTSYILDSGTWIPLGNGVTVNELPVVDVAHGGTGLNTIAAGSIMAANTLDTISEITSTSGLKMLQNNAGTISWNTTTGTGNSVLATSPTFATSVLGGTTMSVFNTGSTTITAFGGANNLTIGNFSIGASVVVTLNIGNVSTLSTSTINFGNATAFGQTINIGNSSVGLGSQSINIGSTTTTANGQTINIGSVNTGLTGNNIYIGRSDVISIYLAHVTGIADIYIGSGATTNGTSKNIFIGNSGVSGSTTTVSIGSSVSGANSLIDINTTQMTLNLTSDATGDIYYRNSSGYFTRLPIGSTSQVLTVSGSGIPAWAASPGGGGGTVTSVDMTVPTGFAISGNPITTTGTLALAFDTGYSLPTTASQTNWNTAYGWGDHASAGYLLSSTAASTYQPLDGDLTSIAGLAGTSGLLRKTAANTFTLDTTAYIDNTVTALSSLATVGTLTSGTLGTGFVVAGVTMTLGSDATGDIYYRNSGGVLTRLGVGTNGYVLTLSAGLPSWAAPTGGSGTVTSVGLSVPTGFAVTGSPVTTSGTLALAFDTGYSLPTTASQTNWDTAFGWGNHASAGYLLSSTAASTYQPLDGDLTSIAGLAGTSGLLRKTAANTFTLDTTAYIDNTVTTLSSLVSVGTLTTGTLGTGFVVAGVTMTLGSDATGDIYYRNSGGVLTRLGIGTTGQLLTVASGLPSWATRPVVKSMTLPSPTNTDDISLFFTDTAITITKMVAVLIGSSTPSVTWTIRYASDRSATGTEVVTSGTTTTSTTTGSVVTSFNSASIPANSFVWLEVTAVSGTVDSLNVSIIY